MTFCIDCDNLVLLSSLVDQACILSSVVTECFIPQGVLGWIFGSGGGVLWWCGCPYFWGVKEKVLAGGCPVSVISSICVCMCSEHGRARRSGWGIGARDCWRVYQVRQGDQSRHIWGMFWPVKLYANNKKFWRGIHIMCVFVCVCNFNNDEMNVCYEIASEDCVWIQHDIQLLYKKQFSHKIERKLMVKGRQFVPLTFIRK